MTMHMPNEIIAGLSIVAWLYLVFGRGGFWLAKERDDGSALSAPKTVPRVTAVVPARDEAACIGECVVSVLSQDHVDGLNMIVVDDGSRDGTADAARRAAEAVGARDRLTILQGAPLPAGWTGKLWAMHQGVAHAMQQAQPPEYLLLTDADIRYDRDVVAGLVASAQDKGFVLVSLMARLRCKSLAERAFIPAFIFFFQMLYPFSWVNRANVRTAAAAGGCMLASAAALRDAGGIPAIRDALIDDCALARRMKMRGPIHLALTQRVESLRPYPQIGDIRAMVARTAYTQLNYSPLLLAAMTLGMALTFLAGPLLAVLGTDVAQLLGAAVWIAMAAVYQPVLGFYRLSPLWGFALPLVAFSYLLWSFDSALNYARGKGGVWKGRVQAQPDMQ